MDRFSALRFSAYARDLEQAILDMAPHGWPIRPKKPEEQKLPMSDASNVTPLPANELKPVEQPKPTVQVPVAADPLQRSITGAGFLGSQISDLIDAIKGEVNSAFQEIQDSAVELRAGINAAKGVSKALKGEAAAIKSKLGQFSNMGPE